MFSDNLRCCLCHAIFLYWYGLKNTLMFFFCQALMSDYDTKLAIRNLICKLNMLDNNINTILANTPCYTISASSTVMNSLLPIAKLSDNVEVHATYTCTTMNNTIVSVYMDISIRDGYIINPSINVVCKQGSEQIKIVLACLQGWLIIFSFPNDDSTIIDQMVLTGKTNKLYNNITISGDDYIDIDTIILPTPTNNIEENFDVNCLAYYVNKPSG